jgi:alanine racemase
MTDGTGMPRSFAATGGILLGPEYHFDLTRPGIGLYGGRPFEAAERVVTLSLPVIQTREVARAKRSAMPAPGRPRPLAVIATWPAGYADGLIRACRAMRCCGMATRPARWSGASRWT